MYLELNKADSVYTPFLKKKTTTLITYMYMHIRCVHVSVSVCTSSVASSNVLT